MPAPTPNSAQLAADIESVNAAVDAALERLAGSGAVEQLHALITRCEADQHDAAADELAKLDEPTMGRVVQALTIRFHLRNKAEQLQIVRINTARESDPAKPRPESIADAVSQLAAKGLSRHDCLALLNRVDVQPTLTAHPTEARRRTILGKQQIATAALQRMSDPSAAPADREQAERDLRRCVLLLFATDEVRTERLRVLEEVRNGLFFLAGTIWDAVPRIHRDVRSALDRAFGPANQDEELPAFLRYRTWIGGDRDGNPNVTADVTRQTLALMRNAAIDRYLDELEQLRRDLSVSDRQLPMPQEITDSVEQDEALGLIPEDAFRHRRHEPIRMKLMLMKAKLERAKTEPATYTAAQFSSDLDLIANTLRTLGLGEVACDGPLADTRCRVKTFGLHLATLDIRQHSARHGSAAAELLALAGIEPDYLALDEQTKLELLTRELNQPRPLVSPGVKVTDDTREVIDTLSAVREAIAASPDAVQSVVVSMTHEVSHLLELMLLMKEAGIYKLSPDGPDCPLDLVPLFETVDDLQRSDSLLEELFTNPVYAKHLQRRGHFQEVMLGYSDSNKDGGYWIANTSLQHAEASLSAKAKQHGIDLRFFHGRGGTVGRGGGRASRAIRATPPDSRNGRIRFTEQGEVITFRYALAPIARRHLEQIVGAMLLTTAEATAAPHPVTQEDNALVESVGKDAVRAYRALIDAENFWPYYASASPVAHIARLPLASRPVARASGALHFDSLRAIPWVFAWTQMRANVPGWFGLGAALSTLNADQINRLADLYKSWPFMTMLIDNAQQEMARARLPIAHRYAARVADTPIETIAADFAQARDAILKITGQQRLLDNRAVIQRSIEARNPATDALNLIQLDLLARFETAPDDEVRKRIEPLIHASINGLAAAMQSTG